jgi:HTH-type transcriptional regulator/antitoxin HigA
MYTGLVPPLKDFFGADKTPGEVIQVLVDERGWTQEEFALIIGRSKRNVSDLILGRSGITPETAILLAAVFGNSPHEWLELESRYRLSLAKASTVDIERRAQLFTSAPIREMQRRGWIKATDDLAELEAELKRFLNHGRSDNELLPVAARRSATLPPTLTPAETAWFFRARQLGGTLLAAPFSEERISKAKSELRRLASHPKEARHLPKLLSEYGIRFVVVEPLSGTRIDGAAMWDDVGPIIAVSLRHDRVDGFWFTLMHEFSHVRHGDANSVDRGMIDAEEGVLVKLAENDVEERANRESASSLIPTKEMDSFISRVGPLYSRDRIIQFANRIRIHPGIIVGQLQYRKQVGYGALRDQLARIRDIVTSTALTDGWGQTISPSRRLK